MKQRFLLVVALIAALALIAACAPAPAPTAVPAPVQPTSAPAAAQPTAAPAGAVVKGTITIWDGYHTGDNEEKTINQLVAAASKQFPDAKISVLEIPFDQLFNKFETEAATGGGPDMYIAPNDSLGKEARAGLLAPLDSMLTGKLDPFSKLSVQGVTVEGKIYAVPMIPKALAMYFNKTTVTAPPATTDDLLAAVKAGKKVGIPNSAYHTFGWWRAFGGSLMDNAGKCTADAGGVADAYTYLMSLKAAGAQIRADTDLDTLYRQGQLDIYFNGPWVLGGNEDALGKDKVGVAPMPKGPKGDAGPMTGIDGWYINANSKNKDSAVALALYFANKDGQTAYANIAGDPAARTDVVPTDPNVKAFADAASAGFPRPQVAQLDNFWGPFGDAATKIFEGTAKPADAITAACAAMNKANKIDTGAAAAPTAAPVAAATTVPPTPPPPVCTKLPNMPTPAAGALGSADKPIVITFVPSGDVPTITKSGEDTATCLKQMTGLNYQINVQTSYAAAIEALGAGKAQFSFLATLAAILARQKYGVDPVLVSTRAYQTVDLDPDNGLKGTQQNFYKGQFITKRGSGITKIADLKGKTFCYTDPLSASGTAVPQIVLKAAGFDIDKDFKATQFAGSHPNVVAAVYKGDCDAGATFIDARTDASIVKTYPDVMDKVDVFFVTDTKIPNDGMQVAKDVSQDIRNATVSGLLAMMADPGGKAVVKKAYTYDALVKVDANFYDPFFDIVQKSGLDVGKFLPPPK